MDLASILTSFAALSPTQVEQVRTYLDLLLRWNRKMNLTAIRRPEDVLARHFGESFFAAAHLLTAANNTSTIIDVGSGAGFPGIPFAIYEPRAHVSLLESHHKKAGFLREVARAVGLPNVEVLAVRADQAGREADLVALRAVEKFAAILPTAAAICRPGGRLALLIGAPQAPIAQQLLPLFSWDAPVSIPLSQSRILLVGTNPGRNESG